MLFASPRSSPKSKGSPERQANAQSSTSAIYQIDIVQNVRITSDEPLTPSKIDQIKKRLGKPNDRGYLSDDDKVQFTQTSLKVVKEGGRPSPPPRPHSASPEGSSKQQTQKRILFYHAHDPYYGFTNFSSDPVEYQGKRYPTSEHLFQSLKFLDHRPELAEHIRTCSTRPQVVFDETHRFNPEVRPDWLKVRIEMNFKMDMVLWHKFTQNKHLNEELLSTGDAELVEDSAKDAFWGVGPDGKGENQLGKALQRLRTKLRDEAAGRAKGILTKSQR
ncbi:hypothetical protein HYDPIDRAFT_167522 [Hydnomerulius pinastri MD-312]|uniref:NADAR domain-containing protein n=1 Tax=Hydnomerulius pinastri MD-312 TaxID=994086 RepID=A0A0C9VI05_9AGAM|nr:hypothetical protein HYDPIDRAFT_167522 [Hydnomerulius pinastri MD-312]